MNKLKAVARSVSFSSKSLNSTKTNRQEKDKLEPVVGFQLTLYDAANDNTSGMIFFSFTPNDNIWSTLNNLLILVPQLDVHLIGARHLPTNFGLKSVEGYVVKVCKFIKTTMEFN